MAVEKGLLALESDKIDLGCYQLYKVHHLVPTIQDKELEVETENREKYWLAAVVLIEEYCSVSLHYWSEKQPHLLSAQAFAISSVAYCGYQG